MSERAVTAAAQTQTAAETSTLHRRCACGSHSIGGAECTNCRNGRLAATRRGSGRSHHAVAPAIVHDALRAQGQSLDAPTRAFMESRFERDFSAVRVHTDAQAAASARAVQAHAYTVAQDIVFAAGQYRPDTFPGRHLLAHELAHVAQARPGTVRAQGALTPGALTISDPADAHERAADAAADAAMRGDSAASTISATNAPSLHRQTSPSTGAVTVPDDAYLGCGQYREALLTSRARAVRLAAHAVDVLDQPRDSAVTALLSRHFHIDPEQAEGRAALILVQAQFRRMAQGLNSGIRIHCAAAPPISGGSRSGMPIDSACVRANAASTSCADNNPTAVVNLCEMYLLTASEQELVKTLLHEFAHIACNGTPAITSGGSGNERYYDGRERLPVDGENVIVEADSYAWFAVQAESIGVSAGGSGPGGEWIALTTLGGLAVLGGAVAVIAGFSSEQRNDLAIGLGFAGIGLGAAGLGVGIAGITGAFDPCAPARGNPSATPPSPVRSSVSATPSVEELSTLRAWDLAQLPQSAFSLPAAPSPAPTPAANAPADAAPSTSPATASSPAASGPAAATASAAPAAATSATPAATAGIPQMQDFARAAQFASCIYAQLGLRTNPDGIGATGREPNAAESAALGETLSQLMGHGNVRRRVCGEGGRGDLGRQPLAGRVRIAEGIDHGVKFYQLLNLLSGPVTGTDARVRELWARSGCSVTSDPSARIVPQERQVAGLYDAISFSVAAAGFYFAPADTIYLSEAIARQMLRSGAEGREATAIAGHEMAHMLGGNERTRRAFMTYFRTESWLCYFLTFEEGMAEITTRGALGEDSVGGTYQVNVEIMRDIMRQVGEDRVQHAYFTGAVGTEVFEALRTALRARRDPSLPPVCNTPETAP